MATAIRAIPTLYGETTNSFESEAERAEHTEQNLGTKAIGGATNYVHALPSPINGYDSRRSVCGISFEGLKINGRPIYETMPGKPTWYQTSDYVPMFVENHVEGITFKK